MTSSEHHLLCATYRLNMFGKCIWRGLLLKGFFFQPWRKNRISKLVCWCLRIDQLSYCTCCSWGDQGSQRLFLISRNHSLFNLVWKAWNQRWNQLFSSLWKERDCCLTDSMQLEWRCALDPKKPRDRNESCGGNEILRIASRFIALASEGCASTTLPLAADTYSLPNLVLSCGSWLIPGLG